MTCSGTALAPFRALLRARENGSLAGMDTRSWPLYFINSITWSFYGCMLGDVYVLLANVICVVMWLYFCLAAIGLLSREEGELAPPAPDDVGDAGMLMRKDALQLHELSKSYRKEVKGQEGLRFLDTFSFEDRLYAFSLLGMAVSLICFSAPIGRLWVLIQKRDGSSVFLPYAVAQCAHNLVWMSYGFVLGNMAVMAPNIPGVFCTVSQILIKLQWPGDSDDHVKEKSFANEHSQGALTTVAAGVSSGKHEKKEDAASAQSSAETTTKASASSPASPLLPASRRLRVSPARRDVTLPELAPILKGQGGVYEDYLKWQRDYQKWARRGSQ
ncbi:swt-1 [Symbiodinium pilosum]|uniref:Swt-1 protein n=1 Tax=Symbiodinium pilosum TaxID=2952 RepID=A0A812WXT9_SYMPI|nr:swt-1 [Symbiodinium pilosum]